MSEIIFLAILALIVIGPKELPELARTLGRFLNELKRSSSAFTDDLKQHAKMDLVDLEPPLKPRKRLPPTAEEQTAGSSLETEGFHNPNSHHDHNVKFDIKPEEPVQLEFGADEEGQEAPGKGIKES